MEERRLLEVSVLERVAPVIRAAAHPVRLRILDYLDLANEPKNVSEITNVCHVPASFVSQQLRILKDQGILGCRRRGNHVYYFIANRAILHLLACIRQSARGGPKAQYFDIQGETQA